MIRIHLWTHRGIQSIACVVALVAPTAHGALAGRGAPARLLSSQTTSAIQSAPALPDSPDQAPDRAPDPRYAVPAWEAGDGSGPHHLPRLLDDEAIRPRSPG